MKLIKLIAIFIITLLTGCELVSVPLWVAITVPVSIGVGGTVVGYYLSPVRAVYQTNVSILNVTNIQIQNTVVSTFQTTSSWNGNLNINYLDGKGTINNLTISVMSNVLTTQTRISNGQTNYISNYSILLNSSSKKRKTK